MSATEMSWQEHQAWESAWWSTCTNTFCEETKQITYAHRMGLINTPQGEFWPVYDMGGKSVLDLGGGPVSMLLKTINTHWLTVVDPGDYPRWVAERYGSAAIDYVREPAEEYRTNAVYDECWIYNVLQHVIDPGKVLENAQKYARLLRIFEWTNVPPCPGHPHMLEREWLDETLGGKGSVDLLNENGCHGIAYYGVFSQ